MQKTARLSPLERRRGTDPQEVQGRTATKGDDNMMTVLGFVIGFVAGEIIGILAAAVLILSNDRYHDATNNPED